MQRFKLLQRQTCLDIVNGNRLFKRLHPMQLLRNLSLWIVMITIGCCLSTVYAQHDNANELISGLGSSDRIEDQYIVVLEQEAVNNYQISQRSADKAEAIRGLSQNLSERYGGTVAFAYTNALTGFAINNLSENEALNLAKDSVVAFMQVAQKVYLHQITPIGSTQSPVTWGLDRIDQTDLPLSNSYSYNVNGSGVNAYVLDSGIRHSHSQFGGRALFGFTAFPNTDDDGDCTGHGTHVAGTIGSSTYGVAKAVRLYSVRVFECSVFTSIANIIAGIDWIANNAQMPAVVNMSFGGGHNTALNQAVISLVNMGITVVNSAGNSAQDACQFSPGQVASVITVGASNIVDKRAGFSNWGNCLDVFAPGVNITSAWHTNDTAINSIDGTSMAAPHVTGAVALYLDEDPLASPAEVSSEVIAAASVGKLGAINAGSPNLLLNMNFSAIPTLPPSVPAGFHIRTYGGGINVLWWLPTGVASHYQIYKSPTINGAYVFDAQKTGHAYLVNVFSNTYYKVRACNAIGCSGFTAPKLAYYQSCGGAGEPPCE